MPIIATAGHVDHGKSTLIRALTGRDPDRWEEEKRRGLTIDLGFSWTELGPGRDVGFVDVPGHERFVKNMLAGIGAVDVALFVVAADGGWMPQSEEHAAVLDLLEVHHGVVALTRIDVADDDTRELAEMEIAEATAGSVLATYPVVAVSAVTGEGMGDLQAALVAALDAVGPRPDGDRPRLWIDRAFHISGAGVVVTGTLVDGALLVGDDVQVWPAREPARVRGLQTHERTVERAVPGTRVAVNLAGVDLADVERGSLIVTAPAAPHRKILVDYRPVRSLEAMPERGAFHLHVGSGAWAVGLVPVDDATDRGLALLELPVDLPLEMGDRFILRDAGRRAVVAGGRVLDPAPQGRIRELRGTAPLLRDAIDAGPDERAGALLSVRRRGDVVAIAAHSGGGRPAAAVGTGGEIVSVEEAARLAAVAAAEVEAHQRQHPLRPGMPRATLASQLGIPADLLDDLVVRHPTLQVRGAAVATTDFEGGWTQAHQTAWEAAEARLRGDGLAVPRASDLGLDDELLHAAIRDERVIKIDADLVYLPEQLHQVVQRVMDLDDGFTVADLRTALGVSRRQAVPLAEWLDGAGWTSRRGDRRTVRRRLEPGPPDAPIR